MSQSLRAGFLLHHINYQESSLIIDVFTQELGRVSIIAKGIRQQKSHYLGILRPFIPLNIAFSGTRELKTLTHVETLGTELLLPGINTFCGFYLNELLRYFLPLAEPHADIFIDYVNCLQQLKIEHTHIEASLRIFEIQLMQAIGYGLPLVADYLTHKVIEPELNYRFDIVQGATVDQNGKIQGATLLAMQAQIFTTAQQLNEAKWLMRQVIDTHLQGKKLKSRLLISKLMQKEICKSN
ncbi:MAG: DNA repair protein RecO [Methyloprofundus sp.]|nr:MAG: DNA repair protein RecO [Methyloprofundus sp.]